MGMRPVPTYLKVLRGNPGKRAIVPSPEPFRGDAPPPCPDYLTGYAREEWDRVSGELFAMRCLAPVDASLLAVYCESYRRWRTASEAMKEMESRDAATRGLLVKTAAGGAVINPFLWVIHNAAKTMLQIASELGMSPVARSRISAGPPLGPSKFRGLIAD
jgi:P27 family predicted phage terminase small subunit